MAALAVHWSDAGCRRVSGKPWGHPLITFGSQAEAKSGAESDIDLATISPLFEKLTD